jgi:hypothetical protein
MAYITFDSHAHDMLARVEDADARKARKTPIAPERDALRRFVAGCEPGSPGAVETIGHGDCNVDEIEAAADVIYKTRMPPSVLMILGNRGA